MDILLAATLRDADEFMVAHPEHAHRYSVTPRSFLGRGEGRRMSSIVSTPAFDAMCADDRGWGSYAKRVAEVCDLLLAKGRARN